MLPYSPLNFIIRFQLIGLFGSRSLQCRNPLSTWMMRPKAPDSTMRPIRCRAGKKIDSELHRTTTPGWLWMACMIASLAALSMPNGFSPIRCLPAAMTAL